MDKLIHFEKIFVYANERMIDVEPQMRSISRCLQTINHINNKRLT